MKNLRSLPYALLALVAFVSSCTKSDPTPKEDPLYQLTVVNDTWDKLGLAVYNKTTGKIVPAEGITVFHEHLIPQMPLLGTLALLNYKVKKGDEIIIKGAVVPNDYVVGGDARFLFEFDTTIVKNEYGGEVYNFALPGKAYHGLVPYTRLEQTLDYLEIEYTENGQRKYFLLGYDVDSREYAGTGKTITYLQTPVIQTWYNATIIYAWHPNPNSSFQEYRRVPLWQNPPRVNAVYGSTTNYLLVKLVE